MADTKISALSAASTLDGSELLPVVQGGSTVKATAAAIAALASGGGGGNGLLAVDASTLGPSVSALAAGTHAAYAGFKFTGAAAGMSLPIAHGDVRGYLIDASGMTGTYAVLHSYDGTTLDDGFRVTAGDVGIVEFNGGAYKVIGGTFAYYPATLASTGPFFFRVRKDVAQRQTSPYLGVATISWSTVDLNSTGLADSALFSTSNNTRIVVPSGSGYTKVRLRCCLAPGYQSVYFSKWFFKNGVGQPLDGAYNQSGYVDGNLNGSALFEWESPIIMCSEGDYFEAQVYNQNGGGITLYEDWNTYFEAEFYK